MSDMSCSIFSGWTPNQLLATGFLLLTFFALLIQAAKAFYEGETRLAQARAELARTDMALLETRRHAYKPSGLYADLVKAPSNSENKPC